MSCQIERAVYDGIVRQSHERLLLAQPQPNFDGLWFKNDSWIARPEVPPDIKSKEEMRPLTGFQMQRPIGLSSVLVPMHSDGAERLLSRRAGDHPPQSRQHLEVGADGFH